jgi:hypothetical protein
MNPKGWGISIGEERRRKIDQKAGRTTAAGMLCVFECGQCNVMHASMDQDGCIYIYAYHILIFDAVAYAVFLAPVTNIDPLKCDLGSERMDSKNKLTSVFLKAIPKDLFKIATDLASEESKLSILAAVDLVFEDGTPERLRDEFDSKLQKWANDCTQLPLTEMDDGSKHEIYETALRWLQTSIDHGFPEHSKIYQTLLNNFACCFMRQRSWGRALTVLLCAIKADGIGVELHTHDTTHDPVILLNLSECLYEVKEKDEADKVLLAVLATLESKIPVVREHIFLFALSTAYYNFSMRVLLSAQALSEVCSGMTVDPAKSTNKSETRQYKKSEL